MQIDKETILNMIRQRGDTEQANQASQELPDTVDPEQHAGLLEKFGLSPQELIGKVTGGMDMPGV